ncbi:MAG: GntR family transcriptional regulator [Actinomycetota bacterium]
MVSTDSAPDLVIDDRAGLARTEIRRLLLDGTLTTGDALKEIELSERIGVSRTPVREALHRLDADGVVERRGRSYVVADLDDRSAADVAQLRQAVEPIGAANAAAAVAAGQVAPASLTAVEATIDDLGRAGAAGDAAAAATANHEFHLLVAHLGSNPEITMIVERLNDRLAVASLSRLRSPEWAVAAARQHTEILTAVRAGDPGGAQRACADHLHAVGHAAAGPA